MSVIAVDGLASENPGEQAAVLRFARAGEASGELTVRYAAQGTAVHGLDYTGLTAFSGQDGYGTGTVTFAAGVTVVDVPLTAVADTESEGTETATVSLSPGYGYTLAPRAATATVGIADAADGPVVGVAVQDPVLTEGSGGDTATFRVSRTGDLSGSLTVHYTVTGTAEPGPSGADYEGLPNLSAGSASGATGTVVFAAGEATVELTLAATDDAEVEDDETIVFTLLGGAGYVTVPAPGNEATALLVSDDGSSGETVVEVAADLDHAQEGGAGAVFRVTRTGDLSAPATVLLGVSGTATPPVAGGYRDYDLDGFRAGQGGMEAAVVFATGNSTAELALTPYDDATAESSETVVLTVRGGAGYQAGSSSEATVTIADNDALPQITVAAESPGDPGGVVADSARPHAPRVPICDTLRTR